MQTRVKICGITNLPDALCAVQAGADAVGFMFYERSPRWIAPEAAAAISRQLPPFLLRVGVFVNASADWVRQVADQCQLQVAQCHGEESPEYCQSLRLPVIKGFRVKNRESLSRLRDYAECAWLLDAYVEDKLGGTGATFNWELAQEAIAWGNPVLLAGGLAPDNVASAVAQVKPYGVDVSSGVEQTPGKKDHARVKTFVAQAKSIDL